MSAGGVQTSPNSIGLLEKEVTTLAFKNGSGRAIYERLNMPIPVEDDEPTVLGHEEFMVKLQRMLRSENLSEEDKNRILGAAERREEEGYGETHRANAADALRALHSED